MHHAIILAGGSGVRFWPLSRRNHPKQFLALAGGQSLLRSTFERLLPLIPAERIWVVTSRRHARKVRRELPELARGHILGEPMGRNTAPAIALAAHRVRRSDPDATLLVLPADSWVPKPGAYRRTLRSALAAAVRSERLVLVGIQPTRPETGYGYIDPGPPLDGGPAHAVVRFEEKPTRARARRFVDGGRHLWNCGVFAWRAEVFLQAVERYLPELHRALARWAARPTADALTRAYRRAPSISVDYGVLERASNVAVVPGAFAWDDLGSWPALSRLGKHGEFQQGTVVAVDSPGHVVWAEEGAVALLGVPDVVVVHTRDATLVVAKDRAQDVRELVARMERLPGGRSIVEG